MSGESARTRASRGARLLTTVFAVATGIAAVTWLLGRWGDRHPNWLELTVTLLNIPLSRSPASTALLAITTWALLARKRAGLVAVAIYQLFGMYLGLSLLLPWPTNTFLSPWRHEYAFARWLDIAALPIGLAVLVWLATLRREFRARLRHGSWLRAVLAALIGLAASVGITYLLVVELTPTPPWDGWPAVRAIVAHLFGVPDPFALWTLPRWLPELASALVTATLLATVVTFLRTTSDPTAWSGERELAIRRLLRDHGQADSLAYFATRRDRSSVFSADGGAVVSYRLIAGVALAAGDPIGDRASWPAAIEAWLRQARQYGWIPAVLGASLDGARGYARAGLQVLTIGDEAVLHAGGFALAGPGRAAVRKAAQHARREGVRVQFARQSQLGPDEVGPLYQAADRWRQGTTERGFAMALNRRSDPSDGQILFVQARDAAGRLIGLLSFVPWGTTGLSLDLMRHSADAPHGVTELMVAELMANARRLGVRRVSLNFCMFRTIFAQDELGIRQGNRLHHSFLGLLDRFWQLERLYRATRRYQPEWVPRVLCFDDRAGLPQIAVAIGLAEGFLPRPRRTSGTPQLSADELTQLRAIGTTPLLREPRARAPEHFRTRLRHLEALNDLGLGPSPAAEPALGMDLAAALRSDDAPGENLGFTGRVRRIRDHGGVVFVDLADAPGSAQLVLEADRLGVTALQAFRRYVDTGDLVRFSGVRGASRSGTPSVLVRSWRVAAKALHPVPFDAGGAGGRPLPRVVDLIVRPEGTRVLRQRAAAIAALRNTLAERGFTEVETPILQPLHGGASARPFTTFGNAYGDDLYLRIAPELYLKRLLVGGMGQIFEIGRNFRNEGADASHNPEFTSLEAYQPGADYRTMQALTQQLVVAAATAVHGRGVLPSADEPSGWLPIDEPWPSVPVSTAIATATGRHLDPDTPLDELVRVAAAHDIPVADGATAGVLIEAIYGAVVEPATRTPTFYTDFPADSSPLTAAHRSSPGLAERWDLVIGGMELATGYSELTDPIEERRRLGRQSLLAAGGDLEAMELDEDFLHALELGMPPTGGIGIGVDRLVMLLTGLSIRSVLSFPYLRRRSRP